MVKFYLPEAQQANPKKRTDYRIIIYKKLLALIKAKHLKQISNIVKTIKQLKDQGKEIQEQQKQLIQLKSIKKRQMKLLALYVIIFSLKISNINILEKITNVGKNNQEIIKQVEQGKILKQFIQKVMNSGGYKTKLQQITRLLDEISKKKHVTKEKTKQRKMKKRMKRKQLTQNNQTIQQQLDQPQSNSVQQNQIEQERSKNLNSSQFDENKEQVIEKSVVVHDQKQARLPRQSQKNDFWNKRNNNINQHKSSNNQREERYPNRTEFIKKGRNRVIQEKKDRKYHKGKQEVKNEVIKPKQKKTQQHPSWIAKQQEKKQACITQFQGKKILL